MGSISLRRERFESLTTADKGEPFLREICQRMSAGEPLQEICQGAVKRDDNGRAVRDDDGNVVVQGGLDIPYHRTLEWIMYDEARYETYKRALEVLSHAEVAEAKQIADDATPETVGVAKLRTDVRFKRAKHHAPKTYGDKAELAVDLGITVEIVRFGASAPVTIAVPGAGTTTAPAQLTTETASLGSAPSGNERRPA